MNEYQNFIHTTHYANWIEKELRRESWSDTVIRYLSFFRSRSQFSGVNFTELERYITNLQVMPSMRCMMTAGLALERDNIAGYNCAFVAINDVKAFAETMYILMCGTGVGFSVERQFTNLLPELPSELYDDNTIIHVKDSRIGWASSYEMLLRSLYLGAMPKWDTTAVRSRGTRLKTFGGRASGPEPLEDLFRFTISIFKRAVADDRRHLTSIECHDLICKIGSVVISGGVRRSALISLSNLSDDRMRNAKTGNWYESTPWRSISNNSAAYLERPSSDIFIDEWRSLIHSKSGERGIYNVRAAQRQAARNGRRDSSFHFGTNPCVEIILRTMQCCNLSEGVARPADTVDNLADKIRIATILGTMQSTLTSFRFLRREWRENCEEERLLGVSLTGIMDNPILNASMGYSYLEDALTELKQVSIDTNKEYAQMFNIAQSTAITCVKPSGTVSQLVNSSSGIHTRYSPYYIRRVQLDTKDPVCKMLQDADFPGKPLPTSPDHTWIAEFPVSSPVEATTRKDLTALDQLEIWLVYHEFYCEHKPSCTIYVKDTEWMEVGAWVYKHFDKLSGIAFLPYLEDETIYAGISPYETISAEEFLTLSKAQPKINWSLLANYEMSDNTTASAELACVASSCEI